jgi:hypothetical protein
MILDWVSINIAQFAPMHTAWAANREKKLRLHSFFLLSKKNSFIKSKMHGNPFQQ